MVLLRDLNTEISELAKQARQSLVQIASGSGAGAGTIWHPDGLIVTNAHVASHAPLRVTLSDGKTLEARVLSRNPSHDLAALVVDAHHLPTIGIGESRSLKSGQWVLALGNPWGVAGAVTFGVVIGVGSDVLGASPANREWIAVGLHLRPGYSGGPLLDVQGRLIGINTMMTAPNVGMAVPVHVVKSFLRKTLGSQK